MGGIYMRFEIYFLILLLNSVGFQANAEAPRQPSPQKRNADGDSRSLNPLLAQALQICAQAATLRNSVDLNAACKQLIAAARGTGGTGTGGTGTGGTGTGGTGTGGTGTGGTGTGGTGT